MNKFLPLLALLSALYILPAAAQPKLHPVPVRLAGKKEFSLQVPLGYELAVAAQGLERPRFFAKSPDGRLFVTDMHNREDNTAGRVLILSDWDETTHRFRTVVPFLTHLHNPNQIAFYSAGGKSTLYVAETDRLRVFDYQPGSLRPADEGRAIARFPAHGLSYKYGGCTSRAASPSTTTSST